MAADKTGQCCDQGRFLRVHGRLVVSARTPARLQVPLWRLARDLAFLLRMALWLLLLYPVRLVITFLDINAKN